MFFFYGGIDLITCLHFCFYANYKGTVSEFQYCGVVLVEFRFLRSFFFFQTKVFSVYVEIYFEVDVR